jgi:GST-like protein
MYDLYTWSTPNGRKVSILLEELELRYSVHAIDITRDAQFEPHFLRISPNNRIPALVDRERNRSLFESGAILLYLAETHDAFMGDDRWVTIEWLMWQMGGLGPMAGQAHHFLQFNPGKAPYAEERYGTEVRRLYGVLERQLEGRDYISGSYSIADIACWPWVSRFQWQRIDLGDYPRVRDWYTRIAQRSAVGRGYRVPDDKAEIPKA